MSLPHRITENRLRPHDGASASAENGPVGREAGGGGGGGEAACVGGRVPHINPPFFSACLSSCAAVVNCIGNKGGKSV